MQFDVTVRSPLPDWLTGLAAPHGNPGGGAAGAVALAMAAALCEMVAGYPPVGDSDGDALAVIAERGRQSREHALVLADADGDASIAFAEAYRLPEGSERAAAVTAASLAAADSAAAVARKAIALSELVLELEVVGPPILWSDVAIAAALVRTAIVSARVNIGVDVAAVDAAQVNGHGADTSYLITLLDECAAAIARLDGTLERLDARLTAPR